jgi:hypothetical protein
VRIASAKHRVDHKAAPCHLQWLKPLHLLVRGPHSVTLQSLVVVHHHGVHSQHHQLWLLCPEPPQKQPLQQMPKQIDPRPPKTPEEALHRVRRKHSPGLCLHCPGIALVIPERIEIHQMTACPIQEKAKKLLEHLCNSLCLAALAHRAKECLQLPIQTDTPKIPDKQAQSAPAGQGIRSHLNFANNGFVLGRFCGRVTHDCLPPDGLSARLIRRRTQSRYTTDLAQRVGFFCKKSLSLGPRRP